MSAPVTAIIAYDVDFWEELPYLFPHEDRRPFFKGKTAYIEDTAFRNSTLQGAYFMIAARAVGLDVGALSGFSNEVVDKEFFADKNWKSKNGSGINQHNLNVIKKCSYKKHNNKIVVAKLISCHINITCRSTWRNK